MVFSAGAPMLPPVTRDPTFPSQSRDSKRAGVEVSSSGGPRFYLRLPPEQHPVRLNAT
jgi:hypothetical protein